MVKKILIANDRGRTPMSLRLIFKKEGYEATEAEDGVEAIEKISQLAPDLIILGKTMPKKERAEVLEKLQANPQTEKIPVILIHTQEDITDEDRAGGSCWGYSSKPFNPRELVTFVGRILQSLADEP